MKIPYLLTLVSVVSITFAITLAWAIKNTHLVMFDTKGIVATQEMHLLVIATGLMLLVVIPVFVLTAFMALHYRAGNSRAKYLPKWEHNTTEEFIWWAVPCIIVAILSIMTWQSSHDLDPFKPLVSSAEPITIEVVALNWKWLFIYPDQRIATINFAEFPAGTPVHFHITADAPMNSFWIPQLAGQIYAMPGMVTQLHILANEPGSYKGSSANFSGDGFAGMQFMAKAVSMDEFKTWVQAQTAKQSLTKDVYTGLRAPSKNNAPAYYTLTEPHLFETIVMKYMQPPSTSPVPAMEITH